jgi:hypothetical protein
MWRCIVPRRIVFSSPLVAVVAATILVWPSAVFAQASKDTIIEREHARAEANHTGKGREALYRPDYFAIDRNGVVSGYADIVKSGADPKYRLEEPFNVQVYGNVALVTGIQQAGAAPGPSRFLRVWVREGNAWKIASFHGTSILQGSAPAAVSRPAPPRTPLPKLSGESAEVLKAQEAITTSFATVEVKTYERYTAPEFVRVNYEGALLSRAEFLKTVSDNQKSVPAGNEDIRIRIYGDVAVETYRNITFLRDGTAGPPERITRVFVKRGGMWQQAIKQFTRIAQPSQTN